MTYFWLNFSDPDGPQEGTRLGAATVVANDFLKAVLKAIRWVATLTERCLVRKSIVPPFRRNSSVAFLIKTNCAISGVGANPLIHDPWSFRPHRVQFVDTMRHIKG
jgi:hypothetical protein